MHTEKNILLRDRKSACQNFKLAGCIFLRGLTNYEFKMTTFWQNLHDRRKQQRWLHRTDISHITSYDQVLWVTACHNIPWEYFCSVCIFTAKVRCDEAHTNIKVVKKKLYLCSAIMLSFQLIVMKFMLLKIEGIMI